MLENRIIDRIADGADSVAIDQSRCLKMRFNKSVCSVCQKHCRFDAVRIDEGVDIRRGACSECMLCVSTCPTGCFDIKAMDFHSLIARLRKTGTSIPAPVLGCNTRPDVKAHERTFCFGYLSEEHVLALAVFLEGGLQINLGGCADCGNGFIVDILKKRIESAAKKSLLPVSEKIALVEDCRLLNYQDVAYDRRSFFQAMKNFTFLQASRSLAGKAAGDITQAYSAKKIPSRRRLLNRILGATCDGQRDELLRAYYYTLGIKDSCNNCFGCVGMCPTGALKIDRPESGAVLAFNASFCSGCGLCETFCMSSSAFVRSGYSGDSPFDFRNVKREIVFETGRQENEF
ncbi:MAG: hypothetical protein Q8K46_06635 [Deltaproteobacteria bacterium]|nr:hypothetical protein [Deltaproteobacteria bacterium]